MKKCAICGLVNGPDEPTCIACGEASWSEEAVAVDTDPSPDDAATSDASANAKRAKRK